MRFFLSWRRADDRLKSDLDDSADKLVVSLLVRESVDESDDDDDDPRRFFGRTATFAGFVSDFSRETLRRTRSGDSERRQTP